MTIYLTYDKLSVDYYRIMKNKKVLWIALVAIDVAITIFLLVISIIMLAQTVGKTIAEIKAATGFIGYLQNHPTFYLLVFVIPLVLLLIADIIALVVYVRKTSKPVPTQMSDLTEEQKAILRQQILEDLKKQQTPTFDKDSVKNDENKEA